MNQVKIVYKGSSYVASLKIEKDILSVETFEHGKKSASLNGQDPYVLGRILLKEIVESVVL